MTTRFKVVLDRQKCIGAACCEVECPKLFKLSSDGKVNLIGSVASHNNTSQSLIIEDNDKNQSLAAANSCPVNAITITRV